MIGKKCSHFLFVLLAVVELQLCFCDGTNSTDRGRVDISEMLQKLLSSRYLTELGTRNSVMDILQQIQMMMEFGNATLYERHWNYKFNSLEFKTDQKIGQLTKNFDSLRGDTEQKGKIMLENLASLRFIIDGQRDISRKLVGRVEVMEAMIRSRQPFEESYFDYESETKSSLEQRITETVLKNVTDRIESVTELINSFIKQYSHKNNTNPGLTYLIADYPSRQQGDFVFVSKSELEKLGQQILQIKSEKEAMNKKVESVQKELKQMTPSVTQPSLSSDIIASLQNQIRFLEHRLNSLGAPTISSNMKPLCVYPYERREGSCLALVMTIVRTWNDARSYCEEAQGILFAPRDFDSFTQYLHQKRPNRVHGIWIGASAQDGVWKWQDDGQEVSPQIMASFNATIPKLNTTEETCLSAMYEEKLVILSAEPCKLRKRFICEQERY